MKKSGSLATHVNRQIRNFTQGNTCQNNDTKKGDLRPPNIAAIVASKIGTGDIRGAVRILASDDKVLEVNEETIEKLRERHPQADPATSFNHPPAPGSPCFVATSEDVRLAIGSFKNGTGGGPDALLAQHLKDMTTEKLGGTATRLLEKLAEFCNLVFQGGLPAMVCPIFYGANLIPLSKKDGGV